MEKLQSLLRNYNNLYLSEYCDVSWSKIYCDWSFPKYWQLVYSILEYRSRSEKIIEIGTGLGDIIAIGCYLRFPSICGIERNIILGSLAQRKINTLFGLNDVVYILDYPGNYSWKADILIMVNCVYVDGLNNKKEYLDKIKYYYDRANKPKCFIFEAISSDYKEYDAVFPDYVRLGKEDLLEIFPDCNVRCFDTYRFPKNKRSKTLFLIEKERDLL